MTSSKNQEIESDDVIESKREIESDDVIESKREIPLELVGLKKCVING